YVLWWLDPRCQDAGGENRGNVWPLIASGSSAWRFSLGIATARRHCQTQRPLNRPADKRDAINGHTCPPELQIFLQFRDSEDKKNSRAPGQNPLFGVVREVRFTSQERSDLYGGDVVLHHGRQADGSGLHEGAEAPGGRRNAEADRHGVEGRD